MQISNNGNEFYIYVRYPERIKSITLKHQRFEKNYLIKRDQTNSSHYTVKSLLNYSIL